MPPELFKVVDSIQFQKNSFLSMYYAYGAKLARHLKGKGVTFEIGVLHGNLLSNHRHSEFQSQFSA